MIYKKIEIAVDGYKETAEKLACISISPRMLRPAIEKDLNVGQNSII